MRDQFDDFRSTSAAEIEIAVVLPGLCRDHSLFSAGVLMYWCDGPVVPLLDPLPMTILLPRKIAQDTIDFLRSWRYDFALKTEVILDVIVVFSKISFRRLM